MHASYHLPVMHCVSQIITTIAHNPTDKINFNPRNADKIDRLHERVASRLRWIIDTNQGLYLKLGQALGLQAALLPKPYREAFGHVFDQAPAVGYDEVVRVFQRDLGVHPDEVFEGFEKEAVASASIAQVHRAKLRRKVRGIDGGEREEVVDVAVKVQKPAIRMQMKWDLASYRALMWLAEKLFDMPSEYGYEYEYEEGSTRGGIRWRGGCGDEVVCYGGSGGVR